eukprot:13133097-Alexandrium_andersonii.AAC.1
MSAFAFCQLISRTRRLTWPTEFCSRRFQAVLRLPTKVFLASKSSGTAWSSCFSYQHLKQWRLRLACQSMLG